MTEVLILANSFKTGGRCVAGVCLDDMRWVRPVSTRPQGELTVHETRVPIDGRPRELKPGDVVEMTLGLPRPTIHHPEDVYFVRGWAHLGTMKPADIAKRLAPVIATTGDMLGWSGNSLDPKRIVAGSEHPSLELRLVRNAIFWRTADGRLRVDVDGLDLSVTDMAIKAVEFDEKILDSALFTISLAEPYLPKHGTKRLCYKLVAAVLPL